MGAEPPPIIVAPRRVEGRSPPSHLRRGCGGATDGEALPGCSVIPVSDLYHLA